MNLQTYKDQQILNYIAAGYALFPCGQDKKPLMRGWQSTPWEPTLTSDSVPAVYGVLLTATDLVLDIDPRRYQAGTNQLQDFWKLLKLPHDLQTFIVKTPSGGLHIYLSKPATMPIKRMYAPGFNAIELKSTGRYVIGAGSVINSKVYKTIRGDPGNLAKVMEL